MILSKEFKDVLILPQVFLTLAKILKNIYKKLQNKKNILRSSYDFIKKILKTF